MKLHSRNIFAVIMAVCAISCTRPGIPDVPDEEDPEEQTGGENPGGEETGGEDPDPEVLKPEDEEIINLSVAELAALEFPSVYITTDNGAAVNSKTTYVSGEVSFRDVEGRYTSLGINGGRVQVRGRGQSSWGYPKKSYRLKLDEKMRVFGMPENKDWDLIANYVDRTLMRNVVAMEVSRRVGMSWSPRQRACDLYLNGTYLGVYLLTEHKEVAKAKVNIDPVKDGGEANGTYYLEMETAEGDLKYFDTSYQRIQLRNPDKPSDEQFNYVKKFFTDVEKLITADNADATTGYPAYLDMDSFINYFILQETSKNIDGNMRKSSFLVKYKDGPLEMYHTWDFDLAYGNCNYLNSFPGATNGPEGWYVKEQGCMVKKNLTWYYHFFHDPGFVADLKARWEELYPSLQDISNYIDDLYVLLEEPAGRNFERWNILRQNISPCLFNSGTYHDHVQYMKDYYLSRIEWMNTEIGKL